MYYKSRSDKTLCASSGYSDFEYLKFHEILFSGYLAMAYFTDFKSIRGR